jgi:outer membrane protein assembly factor BamE (lipoprotein component of BamABCDE complex)
MKLINALLILILFIGCSTPYPNKNPVGEKFPSISGTGLNDQKWKIPEDMKGEKVLLLLGYKMDSQFDIDRWLIGLDMKKTAISVFEIPTIKGMFPRMFKKQIDNGMRKGIPEMLWKAVITVYEDGEKVQQFTGNTNPNNTRVILLDKEGTIRHFDDKGFSVPSLNNLRSSIQKL